MVNELPAEAVNEPEVDPLATTTDAGTVRFALLLCSRMVLEPADAWLKVMVQELVPPAATLVGVQLREAVAAAPARLKLNAAELPFNVAVTVALCVPARFPVAAVKVAVLAFAGTVTEAGTERAELVFARATVAPPVRAALLSVTVQIVFALAARVWEEHCSEETVGKLTRVSVAV